MVVPAELRHWVPIAHSVEAVLAELEETDAEHPANSNTYCNRSPNS